MSDTKLKLEKVNITLDSKVVLDNVNLNVSDGDIVVIGGIKKNTKSDTKNKTPGLGDAPVIGNLFKSKNKTDELKELLIFIAPKVID